MDDKGQPNDLGGAFNWHPLDTTSNSIPTTICVFNSLECRYNLTSECMYECSVLESWDYLDFPEVTHTFLWISPNLPSIKNFNCWRYRWRIVSTFFVVEHKYKGQFLYGVENCWIQFLMFYFLWIHLTCRSWNFALNWTNWYCMGVLWQIKFPHEKNKGAIFFGRPFDKPKCIAIVLNAMLL